MYERGDFSRRLAGDGPTVFGTWVKLPTIETVELLGLAGFDFIVVDMFAEVCTGQQTPKEAAQRAEKRAQRHYRG